MENRNQNKWSFPLSVDAWTKLMCDEKLFKEEDLAIFLRIEHMKGETTFFKLTETFGGTFQFYYDRCERLAKRIAKKAIDDFDCTHNPLKLLFSNYYDINKDEKNTVIKCRTEILSALSNIRTGGISLYKFDLPRIYIISQNSLQLGGLSIEEIVKLKSENRLAVNRKSRYNSDYSAGIYSDNDHEFFVYYGNDGIEFLGEFISECKKWNSKGESWYLREYRVFKKANENSATLSNCPYLTTRGGFVYLPDMYSFEKNVLYPIFDLDLRTISKELKPRKKENRNQSSTEYPRDIFLSEVYIAADKYDDLIDTLKEKKNIILQGAPGVGKTYIAKRLAYSMMGEKDNDRVKFIQFHQSYTYEDFIEGYRPKDDKFILKEGTFAEFCWEASIDPQRDYFFIIDEINRGNISKIFGELLMLIEKDYRNTSASLIYSGRSFVVPDNLYIIGMMNTADRSLAMIDYALRQRFAFFDMEPAFDTDSFKAYQSQLGSEAFDKLIQCVKALNHEISNDVSLGDGFCIGHRYFCNKKPYEITQKWIKSVVNHDILPTLREYWFEGDDKKTLAKWEDKLKRCYNE